MGNEELFSKYYRQLRLRVRNVHNYETYIILLERFKKFLEDRKPSYDLAIEFLAGYHDKAPRTQDKYAAIVKGLMRYYGEPIDDVKIRRPASLPQVVEDVDIEKFLATVRNKQSHKKNDRTRLASLRTLPENRHEKK